MKWYRVAAAAVSLTALAACAHENSYESEAHKITKAMQDNNLQAVVGDIDPSQLKRITRVQVAEAADQLAPLGNVKSVKEVDCPTANVGHCLIVTFDKGTAHEVIALNDQQKVVIWRFTDVRSTQ